MRGVGSRTPQSRPWAFSGECVFFAARRVGAWNVTSSGSPLGLVSTAVRLTPGTRVGPYEVVALLGAGGMAEVYRARDTRLGRDVALKMVSEAIGAEGPMLERFEREARMASSLSHPNVVALYDVGFEDGKPYFVTELLRGESLRERLAKGPLPVGTALEWAAQMAQGLAAAHETGIIHRDLKPENVFLTRDGHLKLIDFGIAKFAPANSEPTSRNLMDETLSPSGASTGTGMVLGTPGYMSPEQVQGEPVDARTDFFSLGAVLYEMLSGRRAFPKGSVVESGYATLHSEPEPLPSTVPAAVAQLVGRCLEKVPGRRFQSARDLAFNLELLRAPTASGTPTQPPRVRTLRLVWGHWGWPLVATLAAFALAGAAFFVGRMKQAALPTVEPITFKLGTVSAARFSPEGRVVYSAAWGGQPSSIFTQPQGSPDAQTLGLPGAQLLGVSAKGELAVDLRYSFYGPNRRGTLAVVPAAGGAPREVVEDVNSADWSPTGELAVVRIIGGKRQIEFPRGTPVFETEERVFSPRVSPKGDLLAFLLEREIGTNQLFVVDRKGQARKLADVPGASGLAWVPSGEEVWFSAGNALMASSLAGELRRVYQGVGELRLEDISRGGSVLVNAQTTRRELAFVPADQHRERGLSWLDWTFLGAISDDGREVVFSSAPQGEDFSYLRPTDGSPPVELGPGVAYALSPDEKWVLSIGDDPQKPSLLPVGAGVAKTLNVQGVNALEGRWLHDGKRIILLGRPPDDKQFRLYLVPATGGVPTRISDAVIRCCYYAVSQDDRLVAARNIDDILTLYPLDGGPAVAIPELGNDAVPAGWDLQGNLWVRPMREVPGHMRRYDIRTHRVLEERSLSPSDATGVTAIGQVHITPDNRFMAFDYVRILGYLYRLEGLAPAKQ